MSSSMTITSSSSSFYSDTSSPPRSPSHSASSSSSSSQPSARFLYNQAAHLFLLRQHSSTLDLLDTLFRQLPRPKHAWTSGSASREGKEKDRDEVRRKAVLLWITCKACGFTDKARSASPSQDQDSRGATSADDLEGERGEDLYRHLVSRSAVLCSPSSSNTPLPLPPTIAQTLIITSLKLGLPSSHPYDLVVSPFLSSLPPTLTSLLAAQSRKRETPEGMLDRTRGNEGWAGDMLDGYEKVLESWCVTILGQSEGKTREASEMIGLDGVLGRSKKEELLQTLSHLPPLTPSPPANISLLPLSPSSSSLLNRPPPRPSSPALSDASETTATPNNFRLGRKGKGRETRRNTEDGEHYPSSSSDVVLEESMWNYSAFVDRIRRFVAPRPPPPSTEDASARLDTSPPSSRLGHPLFVAIRTHLSHLQLPTSVLLMFVLAVMGARRWWAGRKARGLVASVGGAGPSRDVRSRLGRGILARILS